MSLQIAQDIKQFNQPYSSNDVVFLILVLCVGQTPELL